MAGYGEEAKTSINSMLFKKGNNDKIRVFSCRIASWKYPKNSQ